MLLAHLTATDTPHVWLVFVAGMLCGGVAVFGLRSLLGHWRR